MLSLVCSSPEQLAALNNCLVFGTNISVAKEGDLLH